MIGKTNADCGGKKLYTGTLESLFTVANSKFTTTHEIEIEYLYKNFNGVYSSIGKIMPGTYSSPSTLALAVGSHPTIKADASNNYVSFTVSGSNLTFTLYVKFGSTSKAGTQITSNDLSTMATDTGYYRIWV